jgi:hypothetical protein
VEPGEEQGYGAEGEERQYFEPPAFGSIVRGVIMTAGAIAAALAGARAARSGVPWVAATPAFAVSAVLLAWAGLIHLVGGERFDDHRLV